MPHPPSPSTDASEPLFDAFPPVSTDAWEARIEQDLKGRSRDRTVVWHPPEGFPVEPYYRAEDLEALPLAKAAPALYPYTRGKETATNRWAVRQDLSAPDIDALIDQVRTALARGVDVLGLTLAVPGMHDGAPLHHADDVRRLFDAVPLTETALHWERGPLGLAGLGFWMNAAEAHGVALSSLRGSVGFDPLVTFATTGTGRLDRSYAFLADAIARLEEGGAAVRSLAVDVRPYHEAGATAVDEIALALAATSEHLAHLTEAGLGIDVLLRHLHLSVPVGVSYFMEIAKLRALRTGYSRVLTAFGAPDEAARPYVQAATSQRGLTLYDVHANLLRGTTAAAAAIIGGCDVLTVQPFDAVRHAPSDQALRLARNTQHVLREEAYLDQVVDPAAGSYYVEVLTHRLATEAWARFQEIEAEGGLAAALRAGTVQARLRATQQERRAAVATRRRTLVGTNQYPDPDDQARKDLDPSRLTPAEPEAHSFAAPSFAALRGTLADEAPVGDVLDATPGTEHIERLTLRRDAADLEALRLATERHVDEGGERPRVFLFPIGQPALRTARATFARNFFGCAGYEVLDHLGFDAVEDGVEAVREAGAEAVVLCSSDAEYGELAPALCRALSEAGVDAPVIVAGYPEEQVDALRDAGVADFVHLRTPLLETLAAYHARFGITL